MDEILMLERKSLIQIYNYTFMRYAQMHNYKICFLIHTRKKISEIS